MTQQIAAALITAGAALLGALTGLGGAYLVIIWAERVGRQQVIYASAYEHRTAVLVEYYGRLLAVD